VFLPGLLVGYLFDLGYHKIPVVCASALFIVTTFLTPQCTQYWNFLLCQGFVVGVRLFLTCQALNNQVEQLSCGSIFGPTTAVLSQWFQKRLGVALGVAAVGGSIGGTVFPIIARKLIPVVGLARCLSYVPSHETHCCPTSPPDLNGPCESLA
jgi:MFS family permease